MKPTGGKLEVHAHCFIRGPRSCYGGSDYGRVVHSHPGGDQQHGHPLTGPASYTIDKDDWLRATGMSGGGRKKFTAKPTGEQMMLVAIDPKSLEFEIVLMDPPPDFKGEGAGFSPVARMQLASHCKVVSIKDFRRST